jgi:RNA polymerase sigma-70 factor (ECF subfamily)
METTMSELSIEAKALIRRVGTADGPGHADRARVRRRIVAGLAGAGATLGSGTIASGAPAGAAGIAAVTKVTVSSVALWLAAGAALGTAVSAPAVVSAVRRAEQTRAPVSVAAVSTVPDASESAPEAPREAAPPAVVNAAPASPAKPVGRVGVDPPRAATSVGARSLAEETRLLHAAQRELSQKNTSAALALLDEHASRFPGGALAEERTAGRVLALCDLGRTAEARLAADAFVRRSPQSPLVPRLRGSCASEPRAHDDGE